MATPSSNPPVVSPASRRRPVPLKSPGRPVSPMPLTGFFSVTLSKAVEIEGHNYRPGAVHTVNGDVLKAMGDAVVTNQPAA